MILPNAFGTSLNSILNPKTSPNGDFSEEKEQMKCNCCQKEKEIYINEMCKECSDKMDEYLEGEE